MAGLRMPTVSPGEQQKIHNVWDTIGSVEGELAMRGFVPMDMPQYECPQVTDELLNTPDNELYSAIFSRQLAWYNYASQVYAQATTHLLQYENEMELIESRMRVLFRQEISNGMRGKMNKEEMQDEINADPRYSALKLQAQIYKQTKIQMQAYLDGIERGLKVISRQVEIKKMEIEQNKVNIASRGQAPTNHWNR